MSNPFVVFVPLSVRVVPMAPVAKLAPRVILILRDMQDSMAGRIEMLPLLPLSQDELAATGPARFLDRLFAGDSFLGAGRDRDLIGRVLTGGYPDAVIRDAGVRRRD